MEINQPRRRGGMRYKKRYLWRGRIGSTAKERRKNSNGGEKFPIAENANAIAISKKVNSLSQKVLARTDFFRT